MNKTELLEVLEDGHSELIEMLEDLPEDMLTRPGVVGDWSIKDILGHLTQWEGQIVTLLFQAQRGVNPPTTAHFGNENVDDVNYRWAEAGKERSLEAVWQDWLNVRKQTIRRVSEMSETDLTDQNRYPWLKGVPLFQWVLNDSVDHEEEHGDHIREWLDQQDFTQHNGKMR